MLDTIENIEDWAHARNIIEGATPQAQMLKLTEEVGELAAGVARSDLALIKDSIGDAVVVLTILAQMYDLGLPECVKDAYEEIKDRKGKMVNGVFVKEDDSGKIRRAKDAQRMFNFWTFVETEMLMR